MSSTGWVRTPWVARAAMPGATVPRHPPEQSPTVPSTDGSTTTTTTTRRNIPAIPTAPTAASSEAPPAPPDRPNSADPERGRRNAWRRPTRSIPSCVCTARTRRWWWSICPSCGRDIPRRSFSITSIPCATGWITYCWYEDPGRRLLPRTRREREREREAPARTDGVAPRWLRSARALRRWPPVPRDKNWANFSRTTGGGRVEYVASESESSKTKASAADLGDGRERGR
mmetsp:Transcript_36388/g.109236  ORF Transcript_36388/g.109236 Transcript_36388/m.109236 type:complete len:229 (+) Transcript_36388:2699-3385(+)